MIQGLCGDSIFYVHDDPGFCVMIQILCDDLGFRVMI